MSPHTTRRKPEFAARRQYDQPFPREDRLDRRVATCQIEGEGLADPRHVVNPRFQGAWHTVIVHRRPDDEDIRRDHLVDQVVRQGKALVHPWFAVLWRGKGGMYEFVVD